MGMVIAAMAFAVIVAAVGSLAPPRFAAASTAFQMCQQGCRPEQDASGKVHADQDPGTSFDGIDFGREEIAVQGHECALCGIEGLEARVESTQALLGSVTPGGRPNLHALAFDPPD